MTAERKTGPSSGSVDDDSLIYSRIINDERPLRRLTRKFHTYTAVAYGLHAPLIPSNDTSVADARDAFLLELATFRLSLQRSLLVCGAELRQVEEYQQERHRIIQEHENTRSHIEQLKLSLEQAQIERRRKIEYDQITERINSLPSREELELSIAELESDMQATHAEHETQDRLMRTCKSTLDTIITDIAQLRQLGQESLLDATSSAPFPHPEGEGDGDGVIDTEDASNVSSKANGAVPVALGGDVNVSNKESSLDSEENNTNISSKASSPGPHLNPAAKSFEPQGSALRTALRNASGLGTNLSPESLRSTPAAASNLEDDIEMGEVEEIKVKVKNVKEDREEGEASDESSELSDSPEKS